MSACAHDTEVQVVASLAGEPLIGLEITALPFDPQALLDSLAAVAPTPKPDFGALEAELRAFERPQRTEDGAELRAWNAARDSVRRLADSLRRVDHRSAGYAAAYGRFRRLYGRFLDATATHDASVRELTSDVRELAQRAGRAADSLRAWERTAYAGYDSAAASALARAGRPAKRETTDSLGAASFVLENGPWWLLARVPDAENPFVVRSWRTPLVAAGLPFRLPLWGATSTIVWRY